MDNSELVVGLVSLYKAPADRICAVLGVARRYCVANVLRVLFIEMILRSCVNLLLFHTVLLVKCTVLRFI